MEKHVNKRNITFGFIAATVVFITISVYIYQWLLITPTPQKVTASARLIVPSHKLQRADDIFHSGQNGVKELNLLKQIVPVQQDHSGLVISINGRKADNTKHEYWAFYVNGKYANVGPADYITKNSDTIEWKIEKY